VAPASKKQQQLSKSNKPKAGPNAKDTTSFAACARSQTDHKFFHYVVEHIEDTSGTASIPVDLGRRNRAPSVREKEKMETKTPRRSVKKTPDGGDVESPLTTPPAPVMLEPLAPSGADTHSEAKTLEPLIVLQGTGSSCVCPVFLKA
jgi:hypothetical protein